VSCSIFSVQIDFPLNESLFPELLSLVSEERRRRVERFVHRGDAWRSVLGEALARYCIGRREKCSANKVRFAVGEKGKPIADSPVRTEFNVSHSGSWIVCALDDRPIGVDVERIHAVDLAIADRFFSRREYEDLFRLADEERIERFFDYWTVKESYIKALGKGLSCPLGSFTILFENGRIMMNADNELPLLHFRQYDIGDHYKCALCASHEDFPQGIIPVRPEDLIA
jgi:4'-phosphopantetheinyl transferase